MLYHISEKDQLHGLLANLIKVIEEFSDDTRSLGQVSNLTILTLLKFIFSFFAGFHEIGIQEQSIAVRTIANDPIHGLFEQLLSHITLHFEEPILICVVNQTIHENTL